MSLFRSLPWLIVLGLGASRVQAGPPVVYLQNDSFISGGSLTCNFGVGVDESLGAKFTAEPTQYPYTIDHVRVLGCGGGFDAYFVDLYQDDGGTASPGALIWQSQAPYVIDGSQVFNDIPISGKANPPPPIANGSIRVVLVNFSFAGPIGFGTDTDGITPQRNYVATASPVTWSFAENQGVTGDWILRLGIIPNPVPVELQSFTLE